jgi:hypothetical protein
MKSERRGPTRTRRDANLRTPRERDIETLIDTLDSEDAEESVPAIKIATRQFSPEEALFAEMITLAGRDLRSSKYWKRRDARHWILSDSREHALSFASCCDVTDQDVEGTRARLLGGDQWHRGPRGLRLIRKGSAKLS